MNINKIIKSAQEKSIIKYGKKLSDTLIWQLHDCISEVVREEIAQKWLEMKLESDKTRKAYYLSAEFLIGRSIQNNLLNLGILNELENELKKLNVEFGLLEEIEDAALGNGGLGRLAACFMESASTMNIPLDGYGIKYKYGLFKQKIEDLKKTA